MTENINLIGIAKKRASIVCMLLLQCSLIAILFLLNSDSLKYPTRIVIVRISSVLILLEIALLLAYYVRKTNWKFYVPMILLLVFQIFQLYFYFNFCYMLTRRDESFFEFIAKYF